MNTFEFDLHIFDLDDTLVNTKEAYWYAQAAAIQDIYPEVPRENLETLDRVTGPFGHALTQSMHFMHPWSTTIP